MDRKRDRTRPITRSLFIKELEEGPQTAQVFTTLACGEEAGFGDCCPGPVNKKLATTLAVGEECNW
jgi:hypothetical protein